MQNAEFKIVETASLLERTEQIARRNRILLGRDASLLQSSLQRSESHHKVLVYLDWRAELDTLLLVDEPH